jgi:hypothetical protein
MIILEILGVIALWFITGFIINLLLYGHLPVHEIRETETGKGIHIILNIATVIFLLNLIFD